MAMDEATPRRVRAGRMLLASKRCTEVAESVGVAWQTAYTRKGVLDEVTRLVTWAGKVVGRLDRRQIESLFRRSLLSSPTQHAFGTELWILKRVQVLIERMFGASSRSLGLQHQKPERQAIERDEAAAEQFKSKPWPGLEQ